MSKTFVVLLVVYLILMAAAPSSGFTTFLEFLVIVLGIWMLLRLAGLGLRKAIWRLRNRLIVTYVLIGVVPILLIVTLFGLGSWILAGQVAVYLARSELNRRVATMEAITDVLAHTNPTIRSETLRRTGEIYQERFPNLFLLIEDHGELLRWPGSTEVNVPTSFRDDTSGVASSQAHYYAWSQMVRNGTRFIAATPLSRRYLSGMVPGLGDVFFMQAVTRPPKEKDTKGNLQITTQASKRVGITVGDQTFEMVPSGHEPPGPALPPPVNRLDLEVGWPSTVPIVNWETAEKKFAFLVVDSRYSAILQLILSQKIDEFQGWVPFALLIVSIVFLVVELVSLIIGISLTRTITGAVHSLYQGTQRVMQGDFSNRIAASGHDQLADLSKSFNTMTENLERLLVVAKEKERLQAEIEIAREVQEQLYPKTVPLMKTLSVTGLCQPARMVSGDYYDYQKLAGNRLAIGIGDVAGKGISAALLMASIQSAMRMELRASLELAAPSHAPVNGFRLSTARMVSELNQQLHATTSAEKFATFFFALYDEDSGVVTYTNAGHLPPILVRDGGSSVLEVNGTVVGAFPFSKYEESKIQLQSGDLLVCYTDGITEPENAYGEMFGEERLIEMVAKNADRDDGQIIGTVMDAVRQWTGVPELSDDMTIVLVRKQ
ncbi:MAG TPA: PP2C family protein-serine/threonine phosphatase [Bryobacteraceae bacterium]|nr:PP2C family protein-serine/threonine phosphatase [Bryobacteraceae bacterium]